MLFRKGITKTLIDQRMSDLVWALVCACVVCCNKIRFSRDKADIWETLKESSKKLLVKFQTERVTIASCFSN